MSPCDEKKIKYSATPDYKYGYMKRHMVKVCLCRQMSWSILMIIPAFAIKVGHWTVSLQLHVNHGWKFLRDSAFWQQLFGRQLSGSQRRHKLLGFSQELLQLLPTSHLVVMTWKGNTIFSNSRISFGHTITRKYHNSSMTWSNIRRLYHWVMLCPPE